MRHIRRFAAASVLVLALAACGGPSEDEGTDDLATEDAAAPGEAMPAPDASPSDTATPTPTPSATETVDEMAPPPQAAATAPAAFTQCRVCHAVEPGENGIGPSLAGVVGRRAGTAAGFTYTEGMRGLNQTWNDGTLDRYLADPSGVVPGTTMAIGPLDAGQRRAIIAYLKTL